MQTQNKLDRDYNHAKRMKKACYQNKISFIFKKAITLIFLQNIVPVHNK